MVPVTLHSERKKVDRYTFWILILLTLSCILFVIIQYREENDGIRIIAREIANTAFEKDVAYRRWNAMHGGVYVPVTEKTPPNPWLEVPEREIVTPSGRLLTKMNPAYMTRQVYDMMLAGHPDALVGHITSLRPIRPENTPLPWEVEALKSFERGEREFSRIDTVGGRRLFRFMRPFVTEKPCLTCHARQGYREGDIRGGIGITVPIDAIHAAARRHVTLYAAMAGFFWLAGVSITLLFRRRLRGALEEAEKGWGEAVRRESTYRVLFEESQAVMLMVDPDSGGVVRANPAACRFYGYSEGEFSALSIFQINTAERDEVRELIRKVRTREIGTFVARHRLKGGEVRTVEVMSTPVEIEGRLILHSIISDVTERIESERRAEENLSFARTLVSRSTAPTFVVDPSHRVLVWNRAMEELTGISSDDVIGTTEHWRGFHESPRYSLADRLINECLEGKGCDLLTAESCVVLQGKNRNLSFAAAPVYGQGGELLAVIETVFDLTDRYQLRDQLVMTQKMEPLGLLAGGLAHDFNNILTVIAGYATILSLSLSDSELKHDADEILAAVDRASAMTRRLLSYSGRHGAGRSRFDLGQVLCGMQKMLRRLLPENIRLSVESSPEPLPVSADQTQIEQVVMNLLVNARDAVLDGGTVRVLLSSETVDDGNARGRIRPGRYAVIRVEDDGDGIDPEIVDRIFEPFFSTKGSRGTGLGLSIVREIAEAHHGGVSVESTPGAGSRFAFYIPLAEKGDDEEPDRVSTPIDCHGSGTVLVVEDDPEIRMMVASSLRRYGYDPVEAESADQAIALFSAAPDSFRAVISDLVMPGMNGREFIRNVRGISREIPFIIVSGYHGDILTDAELEQLGAYFLDKPFTPLQLLSLLKHSLFRDHGSTVS